MLLTANLVVNGDGSWIPSKALLTSRLAGSAMHLPPYPARHSPVGLGLAGRLQTSTSTSPICYTIEAWRPTEMSSAGIQRGNILRVEG
jgi:hypothetical protein